VSSKTDSIRALVRTSPVSALELLRRPGESSLTRMGEANLLDEVVGRYEDPAVAREVIDNHLTRERQIELIAARGDLPSSAALVVDQDVVFEALLRELADDLGEEHPNPVEADLENGVVTRHEQVDPFVIRAWAVKYHERDDWEELLLRSVGGLTVCEHLLVAIWNDADCPQVFDEPPVAGHGEGEDDDGDEEDEDDASLTADIFSAVGLDPEEARETLTLLIEQGRAVHLSRAQIDEAKRGIAERRRERETAPLSSDAARGGSEATKDELDI